MNNINIELEMNLVEKAMFSSMKKQYELFDAGDYSALELEERNHATLQDVYDNLGCML